MLPQQVIVHLPSSSSSVLFPQIFFFFLSSVICYVLFSLALRFKFSTLFTSLFMLVLFFFFFFVILLTLFLLSFVVIIVGPAPLCSLQDGRCWELVDSKLSFISAHLPSFSEVLSQPQHLSCHDENP